MKAEEEEEDEEEEEEEEVKEEDNEDEEEDGGLVDLDFGAVLDVVNAGENKDDNQKKDEKQADPNTNTNLNPNAQLTSGNNNTQQKIKENNKKQKITETTQKQFSTPKNSTTMQKLFTQTLQNTGSNQKNNNLPQSENKTVFTKLSEELFNKFVSNKDNQNKRTSAYDYLINDMFLNRMCEKTDKENAVKFNSFVQRNKEYTDKKQLKLQERIEKINVDHNTNCHFNPNGKTIEKSELRNPETFLNDHVKYMQTKDLYINAQREEIVKNTDLQCKQAPEISKKSKQLAEKKNQGEEGKKAVHDRLFQEKIHKEKKHVYNSEQGDGFIEETTSTGQKRKTKKEEKKENNKKKKQQKNQQKEQKKNWHK